MSKPAMMELIVLIPLARSIPTATAYGAGVGAAQGSIA